jgi:hypothetical protein
VQHSMELPASKAAEVGDHLRPPAIALPPDIAAAWAPRRWVPLATRATSSPSESAGNPVCTGFRYSSGSRDARRAATTSPALTSVLPTAVLEPHTAASVAVDALRAEKDIHVLSSSRGTDFDRRTRGGSMVDLLVSLPIST